MLVVYWFWFNIEYFFVFIFWFEIIYVFGFFDLGVLDNYVGEVVFCDGKESFVVFGYNYWFIGGVYFVCFVFNFNFFWLCFCWGSVNFVDVGWVVEVGNSNVCDVLFFIIVSVFFLF